MLDRFVVMVRAFDRSDFYIFVALASIAAVVTAFLAFRYFRWSRLIEDTPTSRVRSAHQGYVEFEGHAELMKGEPIRTPMTRRECVWWSLQVQRQNGDKWRTVEREVSDELFYLRDATGACIVDPEGAKVSTPHKRVTTGGPRSRASLRLGVSDRFRYIERFLLPIDRLYVIGFFRTIKTVDNWDHEEEIVEKLRQWKRDQDGLLRRFDANRDGRIDEREWDEARREARREVADEHREASVESGVNVIGVPDDKRPFLIAADHGREYVKTLSGKARWAFAGFVIATVAVVALLAARV